MNVQDEEYSLPPMSSMNTSKEELDNFPELSTDIIPVKFQMVSSLESYSYSTMKYAWKKMETLQEIIQAKIL